MTKIEYNNLVSESIKALDMTMTTIIKEDLNNSLDNIINLNINPIEDEEEEIRLDDILYEIEKMKIY
jgi:hypothetical protein